MKILAIGDTHFCDHTPIKRIDNLREAQLSKIDKIKEVADREGAELVILLGDVFDKARPETWLVNRVIEKFVTFKQPIYSIVGNHCTQGYKDGIKGTAIGTLFASGIVHRLEGLIQINGINFHGIDHSVDHNADVYQNFSNTVIFTHNMIVPYDVQFSHVNADAVLEKVNNCLIFSGDFHLPFEKAKKGSRIINPGVLVRTSIAEKDVNPSVILCEIDLPFNYRCKRLSLNADVGDLVFDLLSHNKEKEDELNLRKFIDSIKNNQFQSQDIESLVVETGKESKVAQNIINEALERIKNAKANN